MHKFSNNTKFCPKCESVKPISEFHKDKTRSDGLMTMCKKCKRVYRISPFYKAREKELERLPEWKARKKRYNDSIKGDLHNSRRKHDKRIKQYGITSQNTITEMEWRCILVGQMNKCAVCSCNFNETTKAERDCIIPLVKGGFLTFDNTQALCKHCNSVKNTHIYSGLGNRWRKAFKNEF